MKKNFFWSMLTIMVVAMLSMTFVSCSDDDDEVVKESSSIVGTWEWRDDESEDYDIITFRKDGTGTWSQYYDDESEIENFSYQYDSSTKRLIMHCGDEVETTVAIVMGDVMEWDGFIYHRIK